VCLLQEFLQNNSQANSVADSSNHEHPTFSSASVCSMNSTSISAATHGFGSSSAHSFSASQPLYVVTNNAPARVFRTASENNEQSSPQTFGDRVRELIVQSMNEDIESESDNSKVSPPVSLLLAALKTNSSSMTDSSRSQTCGTPQPSQLRMTATDDPSILPPPVKRRLFASPHETNALHETAKTPARASVAGSCRANGFITYSNGYSCQKESAVRSAQMSRMHFEQYEDGLSVFADVASRMPTIPASTDGRRQTTSAVGLYLLQLMSHSNHKCQLLGVYFMSLLFGRTF
jgi:hypothetical protein